MITFAVLLVLRPPSSLVAYLLVFVSFGFTGAQAPTTYSIATAKFGDRAPAAIPLVDVIGNIGFLTGPPLVGWIAEVTGDQWRAMWVVPANGLRAGDHRPTVGALRPRTGHRNRVRPSVRKRTVGLGAQSRRPCTTAEQCRGAALMARSPLPRGLDQNLGAAIQFPLKSGSPHTRNRSAAMSNSATAPLAKVIRCSLRSSDRNSWDTISEVAMERK